MWYILGYKLTTAPLAKTISLDMVMLAMSMCTVCTVRQGSQSIDLFSFATSSSRLTTTTFVIGQFLTGIMSTLSLRGNWNAWRKPTTFP